jgi:hypothetical protein
LGERFARFLHALFPGLEWESTTWSALAESLSEATLHHPDVYVIYGEELPEGQDVVETLVDGFGAEAGDEVIEVQPGLRSEELTARRWTVSIPPG